MSDPLDRLYFEWLLSKVSIGTAEYPSAWKLLHVEFEVHPSCPNDQNRVLEAVQIREEFQAQHLGLARPGWACTYLELMVSLSQRAEFQSYQPASFWFEILMRNAGLDTADNEEILEICSRISGRGYLKNGDGGFFPIRRPKRDMRKVELWYQLAQYITENNY